MNTEQLQQFFSQLPPELQQKVMSLPTEQERLTVLAKLFERYQMQQGQVEQGVDPAQILGTQPEYAMDEAQMQPQMGRYGYKAQLGANMQQRIPVEAERNESLTVPQGQTTPQTSGGYLELASYNPVSGQSTYEIPDNAQNNTHEQVDRYTGETGVNMNLPEGSVVNSDKTIIPGDFYIGKSNYKGKTFKEASDKISDLEKKANDKLKVLKEAGEADEITETSFEMNFAKYAKLREELNSFQEITLDLKKQNENNVVASDYIARYGKTMKKLQKAQEGLNVSYENYIQDKPGFRNGVKVLKAAKGVEATVIGVENLMADMQSQNLDIDQLTSRAKTYGLMPEYETISKGSKQVPMENFMYNPSVSKIQNFKDAIAGIESRDSKNPYEAYNKHTSEGTWGIYQFVWSIWKNEIKKQTGIKTPQEWIKNPKAQEEFMDHYIQKHLMPAAVRLKQKYQMPFNLYQIMAGIHLEGEGKPIKNKDDKVQGFLGKYMAGQLSESTMAGKFKNMSTKDYIARFANFDEDEEPQGQPMRYGGNTTIPRFTTQEYFTLEDDNNKYFPKRRFDEGGTTKRDYSFQELDRFKATPISREPFQTTYPNYGAWTTALDSRIKQDPTFLNSVLSSFNSEYSTEFDLDTFQKLLGDKKVGTATNYTANYMAQNPYVSAQTPSIPNSSTDQLDSLSVSEQLPRGRRFYGRGDNNIMSMKFNPETGQMEYNPLVQPSKLNIPPYGNQGTEFSRLSNLSGENTSLDSSVSEQPTETPEGDPQGASSWDKLKYYSNQALPMLNAARILNRRVIPPQLQQKRERYTPLETDVDINDQLSMADRMYATLQSDMRGNPAQRAARMAQQAANLTSEKNRVLSQKYNMQNQLRNQETMRRDDYMNRLDDTNMGLRKVYETERLQTAENKWNSDNMAIEFMMNAALRNEEQKRATQLALSESVYDYDPITGKMILNKNKAGQHFNMMMRVTQYQKLMERKEKLEKELKAAGTSADAKSTEDKIKDIETQLEKLSNFNTTPPKKRLGGKITSKKNETQQMEAAMSPSSNYRKYYPTY